MKIKFQDENSASAALTETLTSSPTVLDAFLDLLVRSGMLPLDIDRQKRRIEILHPTDTGKEIDILIHDEALAIVIECKVNDSQKPYQLRSYSDYWFRHTGTRPRLIWLVRRTQRVLGEFAEAATTITWNQVCDAFRTLAASKETQEKQRLLAFCSEAEAAGIVLRDGESPSIRKVTKGYDQDHAFSILYAIRDSIPGLEGHVEVTNELPPRLFVGRSIWQDRFPDRWCTRLRFIFLPTTKVPNRKGPYHFRVSTMFYFSEECTKCGFDYLISQLPRWSRLAHIEGLEFERNAPGKWKGHHNVKLTFPFTVEQPLKFLFAREPLEMAKRRSVFDWQNDFAAIKAGAVHLDHFLRLVDSFLVT